MLQGGKPEKENGGGAGDERKDRRDDEEAGDVPLLGQLARLYVVVTNGNQRACSNTETVRKC